MAWQTTVYLIPTLFGAVIAIALAGVGWRYRDEPGAAWFVVLMLSAAIWAGGYTVQLAATDLETKQFWQAIQAFGIFPLSVALLAFTLEYIGHGDRVTKRTIGLVSIVPAVSLVLTATNAFHLAWTGATLETAGGMVVLVSNPGPLFPIGFGYAYLQYAVSIGLLVSFLVRAPPLFRGQIIVVVLGVIVPSLAGLAYFVGQLTLINPVPAAFGFSGIVLAWGLFRYKFLNIVPIARGTIVQQSSHGILVVDVDRRVLDINPTATEILGRHGAESVGCSLSEVSTELTELLDNDTEAVRTHEVTFENSNGKDREFEVSVTPLSDHRNIVRGYFFILNDITDLKRREQQLRAQNERLDEFARIVSHDLRNPLNVAMGRLEIAQETGAESDFEAVSRSHSRMMTIITDMLMLARQGQMVGATEQVALDSIAELAFSNIDAAGVHLEIEESAYLEGDASRLTQTFENLFRNAIEHGGTGLTTIRIGILDHGGFYVEDDGTGIPVDARPQIFDPGYTNSPTGTGLGLATVRAIVEAHGWQITVTEGADGGARFEIGSVQFSEPPLTADYQPFG